MSKRTARILTGIAISIAALGLLYGVAVAISAFKLHQAYGALQKDGRPMRIAQIVLPKVPDSENAALLYESGALLLKAQPSPENDLLQYLGDLSSKCMRGWADSNETAELERRLRTDAISLALEIVEQGADRPSCRFDLDFEAGNAMRVPEVSYVRNLVYILGAKANLDAKAGHADNAWRAVKAQMRLASAMRNEPLLLLQLAGFGATEITCETIQSLCRTVLPAAQQVHDIGQAFRSFESMDPLVRAVDGERLIFGEPMFRLPKNEWSKFLRDSLSRDYMPGYMPDIFWRFLSWRATFRPLFLADHADYLQWSLRCAHFVQDPNALDRREALNKELFPTQKHHFLTSTFGFDPRAAALFHFKMIATARITLTGLALLLYKQAHGSFPESLDTIGMQNVEDPFSHKPVIYRREGGGFVLYSVGEDRKDNGGTPRPRKGNAENDIVWRFPASEPNIPDHTAN
jgi:hypothetical protein